MGVLADLAYIFESGYGWLIIAIVGLYELYAPKLLNQDTALAPLVRDMPEKMANIEDEQKEIKSDIDDVQGHVEEVQNRQKVQMQVQRAQARANDQMNEEQVDDYLLKNGVEPDEFLRGDEMEGYQNWTAADERDADDMTEEIND